MQQPLPYSVSINKNSFLSVLDNFTLIKNPKTTYCEVFKHFSEDKPWFEGCFIISARFDPRLLGELLVRPLAAYKKPAHSLKIKFYLEDGNHRALVYAVFLRLDAEAYQPVRVIFSKDWTHLYPWAQVTA